MDAQAIERALTRIAHEVLERNRGTEGVALIGIRSRGVYIAERLKANIRAIERVEPPTGIIDITLYRDDLGRSLQQPEVKGTQIPFAVDDKRVILVDDVLFTGRTIRAAMEELIEFGRPERVQLAVLVDRGHRELPIQPDYVGLRVETTREQSVRVMLRELGETDEVVLCEKSSP